MSTKELNCNNCNFIFGNEQLFNIHLTKCRKGFKNSDPKNSYYCPVCDGGRYFRLFSNLLRHQETKKHNDLLNWYLKQFKPTEIEETVSTVETGEEDEIVKTVENDSNMISNEIDNLKNFENDLEANLNSLEKELNIDESDFFNKLENNLNQEIKEEISVNQIQEDKKNEEPAEEEEDEDDFIKNLIKEREKDLKLVQKPNIPETIEKTIEKNNAKHVPFNLNEDIKNAKELIQENKMSLSEDNSNDIEINDNILDMIQNQRTQEIKKQEHQKQEVKKPEVKKPEVKKAEVKKTETKSIQNANTEPQKYPPQMRETPIWKSLFKIINEPKPVDNFMIFMSKLPITEYPKACTFIYFVEELERNLEIKVQLIMCLIQIYNNFVKLINMRQFIYNGVNLLQMVGLMNNWKLNETLINTKKRLELSKQTKV